MAGADISPLPFALPDRWGSVGERDLHLRFDWNRFNWGSLS